MVQGILLKVLAFLEIFFLDNLKSINSILQFYRNCLVQVKYLFGISAGTNRFLNKFLPFTYIISNCIIFFLSI